MGKMPMPPRTPDNSEERPDAPSPRSAGLARARPAAVLGGSRPVETAAPAIASARPTRVRHGVMGLMVTLVMMAYPDRVCIGKLAPDIMRDLSLSKEQMITTSLAI